MHSLPILLGLLESPISWRMEERWKWRSGSLAMPTAGQRSSMTDVVRESWSKIWSGFDTDQELARFGSAFKAYDDAARDTERPLKE
jgi:hypothetical protein